MFMKQYVASRNNFISLLDQTFPGINNLFSGYRRPDGHEKWVDVAARFWHAECVSGQSLNAFTKVYKDWCSRNGYRGRDDKAEAIYRLAKESIPSLPKNDFTKAIMATTAIDKGMPIEQVQRLLGHEKIDTTLHYAMVKQNNVKMSHKKFIG